MYVRVKSVLQYLTEVLTNIVTQHFLCLVHIIGSFIPKPNKENETFMLCDVGNRVILYH